MFNLIQSFKSHWQTRNEPDLYLKRILKYTDNLILIKDLNGQYIYANPRFYQLFNLQEKQVIGKRAEHIFPAHIAEKFESDDITLLENGLPIQLEQKVRLDNPEQSFYITKFLLKDDNGQASAICSIATDITKRTKTENALRESRAQLRLLIDTLPDIVWLIDADGVHLGCNKKHERLVGLAEADIIGKTDYDLFDKHKAELFHQYNIKTIAAGRPVMNEEELIFANDGHTEIVEVIRSPMYSEDGSLHSILSIARDISERKKAEKQLMESETKFKSLFQSAVVGIIVVSEKQGNIMEWNTGAEQIFGYSSNEIVGKPLSKLMPKIYHQAHSTGFERAVTERGLLHGGVTHEVKGLRKNRQEFPMELTLSSWISNDELFFSGVILDISERKQAEEKILHQAHFDNLTNLPNRFLSLDRLSQLLSEALRNNEKVALLFLDLDDFKKINDTLGHETGDKLLIEAALRLQKDLRSGDTVGRLGGDEFIILLGGLEDAAETRPIAENLLNKFSDAFRIDNREMMITASMGIAVYPEDGDNASELLRNADAAMYHSKELGRNTYSYFTESMNRGVSRRLALEEQIHGALGRGEFSVYYQPQLDIKTGKIIGAEALLRWSNPALGAVSPVEFIPVAEQTGLIIQIGQFVLTEALQKTAQWQQDKNPDFKISVNLSPRQFRDTELVEFIKQTIKQSGITENTLELEITEGILLSGHNYIDQALKELNELNIRISMDDFGTGYSSLNYLRKYPFDVLKIDRSFINDLSQNPDDQKLIIAMIAMAHGLNLKVVAEGVETEEQLDFLKQFGCDTIQGFLISKPVPEEQMTALLAQES